MPRNRVAIVGAAESDFGTVPDKTVHELHAQAAVRAIEDAGVGRSAKSDVGRRYRSADAALSPRGPNQYEVPFGPTLISKYAMIARRHMYQYATTSEQLAAIAVAMRKNASRNPRARNRGPITAADV